MKVSEAMDVANKMQPDDRQRAIDEIHNMYGGMSYDELTPLVRSLIASKKTFMDDVTRSYIANPLHSPTQKQELKKLLRLIENLYDAQVTEVGKIRRGKKRS